MATRAEERVSSKVVLETSNLGYSLALNKLVIITQMFPCRFAEVKEDGGFKIYRLNKKFIQDLLIGFYPYVNIIQLHRQKLDGICCIRYENVKNSSISLAIQTPSPDKAFALRAGTSLARVTLSLRNIIIIYHSLLTQVKTRTG